MGGLLHLIAGGIMWGSLLVVAGGRDVRGGPVLLLTQPRQLEIETLIEMTDQEFFDMLAYFASVPRYII